MACPVTIRIMPIALAIEMKLSFLSFAPEIVLRTVFFFINYQLEDAANVAADSPAICLKPWDFIGKNV